MAKRIDIPNDEYLSGLGAVVQGLQDAVDNLGRTSLEGAINAAFHIGQASHDKVPVDTGDLGGSFFVVVHDENGVEHTVKYPDPPSPESKIKSFEIPPLPPGEMRVDFGYCGPYAAYQHEHTEFDHPRGGQAKYLENTIEEERDTILQLIAGGGKL